MGNQPFNVLFLCTGNSARSIIAEAILNKASGGRFRAYSAGSHPKEEVHPETIRLLQSLDHDTSGFRSKSWDEFTAGPNFDFVFTVCDNAARETCPVWPGQPMTAHWGVPDPAAVEGTPEVVESAFRNAFFSLDRRISLFLNLPMDKLDHLALKKEIEKIGRQ